MFRALASSLRVFFHSFVSFVLTSCVSHVMFFRRPKFILNSAHKKEMAELRSAEQETRQKVVRALNRSHEDELDEQRAEARSARIKLERDLSLPPTAPPAPPIAPVATPAPVAHAQAHMHFPMQPQPMMMHRPISHSVQYQAPNMGHPRMYARMNGYCH